MLYQARRGLFQGHDNSEGIPDLPEQVVYAVRSAPCNEGSKYKEESLEDMADHQRTSGRVISKRSRQSMHRDERGKSARSEETRRNEEHESAEREQPEGCFLD